MWIKTLGANGAYWQLAVQRVRELIHLHLWGEEDGGHDENLRKTGLELWAQNDSTGQSN